MKMYLFMAMFNYNHCRDWGCHRSLILDDDWACWIVYSVLCTTRRQYDVIHHIVWPKCTCLWLCFNSTSSFIIYPPIFRQLPYIAHSENWGIVRTWGQFCRQLYFYRISHPRMDLNTPPFDSMFHPQHTHMRSSLWLRMVAEIPLM
jgi:hypothetical protein